MPAPVQLRVAVIGLGEAGGRLAADLLERGVEVAGYDPDPGQHHAYLASDLREAVARSDVVLSVNTAAVAESVAAECAPALAGARLYADLNTTAPALKQAIAGTIAAAGVPFADVALLAPVPGAGIRTPALASGTGASSFAEVFGPLGMPVEVVGHEPGQAAERKLLRSVFMKGLAAAVVESLEGARAAGCEDWLRESIASTFERADTALFERLADGRIHAARRVDEMDAAAALLRELGVEPRVATAAAEQLAVLALEHPLAAEGAR